MPGWSSVSDMLTETVTNGKADYFDFRKVTANGATLVAGQCLELLSATGTNGAIAYSGTAGVATQLTSSTTNAINLGNVSTDLRFLLKLLALSPTATFPICNLWLCDFLLYYPACVVTGTPTTLNNTATLPRYTDGKGVQCIVAVDSAQGAVAPILTLTYSDSGNNSQSKILNAAAISQPVSALYTATAAATSGPFLPMGGANVGVKSITSYTLSAGTTGTVSFILVRPLMMLPIIQQNVASEKDCVYQFPSLPNIVDGACLGFIAQVGGALVTSAVMEGRIDYGWG